MSQPTKKVARKKRAAQGKGKQGASLLKDKNPKVKNQYRTANWTLDTGAQVQVGPGIVVPFISIPGNSFKISDMGGKDKIQRCTGTYLWGEITYTTLDGINELLYSYPDGTRTNTIILHPDYLFLSSSRQRKFVENYMQFRVNKFKVHYIPQSSSSSVTAFALCGYTDGAIAYNSYQNSNYDWSDMLNTEPAIVQSVWKPGTLDMNPYLRREWCYYDVDYSSQDPSARQCFAGGVSANTATLANWTNGGSYGYIVLEYEIDVSDPAPFQNLAAREAKRKSSIPLREKLRARRSEGSEPELVSLSPEPESDPAPLSRKLTAGLGPPPAAAVSVSRVRLERKQ